ncbi:MAG: hypothetical protein ACI4A3_03025, partial [Lachnospiraceae bacterium]
KRKGFLKNRASGKNIKNTSRTHHTRLFSDNKNYVWLLAVRCTPYMMKLWLLLLYKVRKAVA